ncbi:nucleoside monophosphate kinase [Candidatus Woesearchaeota archaeon]|nr:nucleoside monophosphate kinase [Candidatus Woesearchaeota archaeon]
MIITISGALGSGKSTIAKELSKRLGIEHFSTGDFMRQMANERKVTVLELNRIAETDSSVDQELDERQKNFGATRDNFVIDGRLSWFFIPHSIKVFLDVSDEEAAKRIFHAKRPDEHYNDSLQSTLENIHARRDLEVYRYKKIYNVDYYDKKHYNIVIDTTHLTIPQVVDAVLRGVQHKLRLREHKQKKKTEPKQNH